MKCCQILDMNVERNILLEKAYPSLRKYCQQLGLDFQVSTEYNQSTHSEYRGLLTCELAKSTA